MLSIMNEIDPCFLLSLYVLYEIQNQIFQHYKAWNISCSPSEKDEKWIRDRFQFPDSVKIRIPSDKERACHSYANEVCFYEADFTSSLCFPVHPFNRDLFSYLHLAPAQLVPNSWQILVSCMVVWMSVNEGDIIRRDEFLHFYCLRKSKNPNYYEFKLWDRASRLILDYPLSLCNWKPNFLFISGSGWEFVPNEVLDEAPKFFRSWRVPMSSASSSSSSSFQLISFFFWGMTMIGDLLVSLFRSCPASLSEEELSVACGKSKGIFGDRQGF